MPAAVLENRIKVLNVEGLFPDKTLTPDASFGTSGKTEHEFYTAKDFPIITDETPKTNKQYRLSVAIPFLGSISVSKLTTSQGYSIVTNDMHGKDKRESTFRQSKDGSFEEKPVSWVQYNYRTETGYYNKNKVLMLSSVFKDNEDGTLSIPTAQDMATENVAKYSVGQEVDFFPRHATVRRCCMVGWR